MLLIAVDGFYGVWLQNGGGGISGIYGKLDTQSLKNIGKKFMMNYNNVDK
jgi:hypothetical protein